MKKMTKHQIVSILKEAEAAFWLKSFAENMPQETQLFTNGEKNTAVWKPWISND